MLGMIFKIIVNIRKCLAHCIEVAVHKHFVHRCPLAFCPAQSDACGSFLFLCRGQLWNNECGVFFLWHPVNCIFKSLDLHSLSFFLTVHCCQFHIQFRSDLCLFYHGAEMFFLLRSISTKNRMLVIEENCLSLFWHILLKCFQISCFCQTKGGLSVICEHCFRTF